MADLASKPGPCTISDLHPVIFCPSIIIVVLIGRGAELITNKNDP